MITEEQYKAAQAIVDQYHEERQREAELSLDEDDPMYWDDEDEDDLIDRRENELAERAWSCTCGAWTFNTDKTKVLHVADCICGAE
jgi:hypothetical protein